MEPFAERFVEMDNGTRRTNAIQADTGGVFPHIPDRIVYSALARQQRSDLQALKELPEKGNRDSGVDSGPRAR